MCMQVIIEETPVNSHKRNYSSVFNKDNTNAHARLDMGKPVTPQPYTKCYRKPKKARDSTGGLPQCQMISLENKPTGSIIRTEQVIFINKYVFAYESIYAKVSVSLKKSEVWYMGGFGGRKKKRKL